MSITSNNQCSYVMAAASSFRQHAWTVVRDNPEYMTAEAIDSFLSATVNKILISFGMGIRKDFPIDHKVPWRFKKFFDKIFNCGYMNNCEFTLDSGGFQLQTPGFFKDQKETGSFIDLYYDFIAEHHAGKIDYAFMLDPAPGAHYCLYDSWKQIEDWNHISYAKAATLPSDLRDKMLYIHHFRTPNINRIWKRMLFDMDMAAPFKNFATGGLVSFANSSQTFPVVLYVVPLIHLITYAKTRGLKKFRFHCLGASEFKDQVMHKLFEMHVKKIYDIDLEITYDSSTIFRLMAHSRRIYIPDWDRTQLWKTSLRSVDLQRRFRDWGTIEEIFYRNVNKACKPHGIKEFVLGEDNLYENNRLTRVAYMYGIFYMLQLYKDVDDFAIEFAKEIYPIYESGDIKKFDYELEKVFIGFNSARKSKRTTSRTTSIATSLDALTALDMDYADYLVDRYMGPDENKELNGEALWTF